MNLESFFLGFVINFVTISFFYLPSPQTRSGINVSEAGYLSSESFDAVAFAVHFCSKYRNCIYLCQGDIEDNTSSVIKIRRPHYFIII